MVEHLTLPRETSPSIPSMPTEIGGIPTTGGVDELHELRVRIPVNLHRQLLSLKVLRGRSLAETVSLALDIYFSQVKSPPQASAEDRAATPLAARPQASAEDRAATRVAALPQANPTEEKDEPAHPGS